LRLYLAHPFDRRKQIREVELGIEKITGIELHNPFYDSTREDICSIDAGREDRCSPSMNFRAIVEGDLSSIDDSDGIVAYIENGVHSIGTMFELWNTAMLCEDKYVFVVSADSLGHPWIRYLLDYSGGQGFLNWKDFTNKILEVVGFNRDIEKVRKNTCGGVQ